MSTRSVLIVEHNKDLRDLLSYIFKKEELAVYAAKTGKKAFKLAKKEKPSFIILGDLKKLDKQIHFCEKIRTKNKLRETPIIMLTTDPNFEEKGIHKLVLADRFIITPIKPKKLVTSVMEYIASLSIPSE